MSLGVLHCLRPGHGGWEMVFAGQFAVGCEYLPCRRPNLQDVLARKHVSAR